MAIKPTNCCYLCGCVQSLWRGTVRLIVSKEEIIRKRRRLVLGVIVLLLVDVIWVASAELSDVRLNSMQNTKLSKWRAGGEGFQTIIKMVSIYLSTNFRSANDQYLSPWPTFYNGQRIYNNFYCDKYYVNNRDLKQGRRRRLFIQ